MPHGQNALGSMLSPHWRCVDQLQPVDRKKAEPRLCLCKLEPTATGTRCPCQRQASRGFGWVRCRSGHMHTRAFTKMYTFLGSRYFTFEGLGCFSCHSHNCCVKLLGLEYDPDNPVMWSNLAVVSWQKFPSNFESIHIFWESNNWQWSKLPVASIFQEFQHIFST